MQSSDLSHNSSNVSAARAAGELSSPRVSRLERGSEAPHLRDLYQRREAVSESDLCRVANAFEKVLPNLIIMAKEIELLKERFADLKENYDILLNKYRTMEKRQFETEVGHLAHRQELETRIQDLHAALVEKEDSHTPPPGLYN